MYRKHPRVERDVCDTALCFGTYAIRPYILIVFFCINKKARKALWRERALAYYQIFEQ